MTSSAKVYRFGKILAGFAVIAAAVGVCAPAPNAGSEHFVIINNGDLTGSNLATVLKLEGTAKNPMLNIAAKLDSGELSGGGSGNPSVQVVRTETGLCVFMTDGIDSTGANQISSFKYPSLEPVGNFTDSNVPNSYYPYVMAASGTYLFVGFSHYISSWAVGSGCTLSLLQTTHTIQGSYDWALTPNGKTLIGSSGSAEVDSYSIGPNGAITENGPYFTGAAQADGIDITADGQYAIFAAFPFCNLSCTTFVVVISIEPDGTLGNEYNFGGDGSLGDANEINYVRLSPNEKFLFASAHTNNGQAQAVTLNFTENPLNISYGECVTPLKLPSGAYSMFAGALATTATSGAGEGLYIADLGLAETYYIPAVSLLTIDSHSGCTSETTGSPELLADPNSYVTSLVAWPPRPF